MDVVRAAARRADRADGRLCADSLLKLNVHESLPGIPIAYGAPGVRDQNVYVRRRTTLWSWGSSVFTMLDNAARRSDSYCELRTHDLKEHGQQREILDHVSIMDCRSGGGRPSSSATCHLVAELLEDRGEHQHALT